jgi:kinesin family member 5
LSAQKGAVSSPLSFAGRIAKPLRGGGGGTVPRAETAAPPVVPANSLARVQNEERYANVSFAFVVLLI